MLESGTKQPGLCLPLGNSWHASREAPGTTLSGEPRFPTLRWSAGARPRWSGTERSSGKIRLTCARRNSARSRCTGCWTFVFREYLAGLRSGHAPGNIARYVALNLLSRAKPFTSFKNRCKKAGWDIDYLEIVLRHTE